MGKVLSPRIRDLGKITLCRDATPTEATKRYPHAGPLLTARWNEDLITDCWPDLLRMAGSLKYGEATASLIVGKWSAASRQNTLAAGLKEWGMLRRTIHAAKYLSDPAYRRKIARQLNKGESLHALRRDLHYAHQGTIQKPQLTEQSEQAWCLTVLTNAVVTWSTEYYSLAVAQLRAAGRNVPDEVLAHISPAHSENINFFGVITVDVEAELASSTPPAAGRCARESRWIRDDPVVPGGCLVGASRYGAPMSLAEDDLVDLDSGDEFEWTGVAMPTKAITTPRGLVLNSSAPAPAWPRFTL